MTRTFSLRAALAPGGGSSLLSRQIVLGVLLPVWLLALPVTWHRSAGMPRRFRVSLLACVTVGIAALAQGANFWILASKLDGLHSPLALHAAHVNRAWSWVLFALSLAAWVTFSFFFLRGTRVAKRR